ncbi:hypothetical+protein [Methylocapsa aurea]|uniref:sulfotransferase family protein n=1 Tax=Methylocapsa aurea TaxID=663610 RepID=UPI003D188BCB
MSARDFNGWTPYRAAWLGDEMIVDWCHHGSRRFTEPFYYETIARAFTQPFNQLFQRRTLAADLDLVPPGLAPTGFVFHMSRCGSTLLGRALAADPANIAVSEASPIRNILQADRFGPATRPQRAAWLAGIVNAFAQRRFPEEKHVFVKFFAADVLDLPLILDVFPNTPWVFLCRHPLEILASQRAAGGVDTTKGNIPPHLLGLAPEDLDDMSNEVYLCRVMAAFGRAALAAHRPGRSLILDYRDLPSALYDRLPAHFGLALDDATRAAMTMVLGSDAKNPSVAFQEDSAIKRAAAAPFAELVELLVGPTYAALTQAARASNASLGTA